MYKQLRWKFVGIAGIAAMTAFGVLFGAIALNVSGNFTQRADAAIDLLYANDGQFPPPMQNPPPSGGGFELTQETPYETRYFVAKVDADGNIIALDLTHIASVNETQAQRFIRNILRARVASGTSDQYRYRVYDERGIRTVIVVDTFLQTQSRLSVLSIIMYWAGAFCAVLLVMIFIMSKRIMQPFIENAERQRQFITDASHELKTPLAIISANSEILEMTAGENEWLHSTKAQVERMNHLIKNLIELSTADERIPDEQLTKIPISDIVREATEAFESVARSRGKTLTARITPDLTMTGLDESIYRLISILLDNAIKYSGENGAIKVSLTGGKVVKLVVSNIGEQVDTAQLSRFFDRFYRADPSRARETGGFGIGLSVAKTIVERHHGRITVAQDDGWIVFTVTL